MASMAQVRADMATLLGGISGLTVKDKYADRIEPPCAIVGFPRTIEYEVTFGKAKASYTFPVHLYVSRYDVEEGVAALDAYVLPTGALSIKFALEAAGPTSGWDFCNVTSASGFDAYRIGEIDYLGCEFEVEIIAA